MHLPAPYLCRWRSRMPCLHPAGAKQAVNLTNVPHVTGCTTFVYGPMSHVLKGLCQALASGGAHTLATHRGLGLSAGFGISGSSRLWGREVVVG